MATGMSRRVFGSDIPKNIQKKLEDRQALSSNIAPTDSLAISEDYQMNFEKDGFDLNSRTTWARLWTANELVDLRTESDYDSLKDAKDDVDNIKKKLENDESLFVQQVKDDPKPVRIKKVVSLAEEIHIIGNHLSTQNTLNMLKSRETWPNNGGSNSISNPIKVATLPRELQSSGNEFMQPPTGIKSVTVATEGMGAIKRATINFRVYNQGDFQNIYQKYFLKPGALLFLDFGWDTSNIYDPKELLQNKDNFEEYLYGPDGVVTLSHGDMDTMSGNVTNFTAKSQDDGSYDCSVEITSQNVALLGNNLDDHT